MAVTKHVPAWAGPVTGPLIPAFTAHDWVMVASYDKSLDSVTARMAGGKLVGIQGAVLKYFDVDGTPITRAEWVHAFMTKGRLVAQHRTDDGLLINTVWMGMDTWYNPPEAPRLFESLVSYSPVPASFMPEYIKYATLEEARAGHEVLVKKWDMKYRAEFLYKSAPVAVREAAKAELAFKGVDIPYNEIIQAITSKWHEWKKKGGKL